jgi:hypothetical protein
MPARRHLRLRATRRLGTTRNTRGFIFAVASMARFRRFHGGKKRWKTHLMLDKVCCCHPLITERGGRSAPIQMKAGFGVDQIRPKIRALCTRARQLPVGHKEFKFECCLHQGRKRRDGLRDTAA